MVISFPVLWSICLSSSRVHLKNGPEYQYLFFSWGFWWRFLSRVVFAFSWDILFGSCLSFALVWWCQPPRCHSIWRFHFHRAFLFFWDYYYYYYYYYYFPFISFYTSFSWRNFTWFWVTAILLVSPGLFSVFRPISIMWSSERSPFFLRFKAVQISILIIGRVFQVHQRQLVSLSPYVPLF